MFHLSFFVHKIYAISLVFRHITVRVPTCLSRNISDLVSRVTLLIKINVILPSSKNVQVGTRFFYCRLIFVSSFEEICYGKTKHNAVHNK